MMISIVAGARPNFVKIAPIIKAIEAARTNAEISYRLVHTGQHYDKNMSGDFFSQLEIPEPDVNLGAGSGTQAEQTAEILIGFERELLKNRPDLVLVVGDVNSTMACAISAKKLCVPVVHVEAGIRSGDMRMPEEINRIVTDSICDHFFTTSETANDLLRRSGIAEERIHFVGNTMIDALKQNLHKLRKPAVWDIEKLQSDNFLLLTLHRPANVDEPSNLGFLLKTILQNSNNLPTVFPVHPRTRSQLSEVNFSDPALIQIDPLSYHEFIYLLKYAKAVITDSGGITEEATVLGIPCLTLRDSTERPETISFGTNELIGTNPENLEPYMKKLFEGTWKNGSVPPLWDGNTSERIVSILLDLYATT